MYSFDYVRASSVAEAAQALAAGGEATLIAGGHTLIPTLKQRLARPKKLVDISGIAELKGIRQGWRQSGHRCRGTTHGEVAGTPRCS